MNKYVHNITIVNAHWNNRGDEAALMALISELISLFPKTKISIAFKDGKSIEQFPFIENVTYFDSKFKTKIIDIWLTTFTRGYLGFNKILKKLVRELTKSDIIIYSPGGSVINKNFFWWKQMEYLVPFICAKFYKIKMFVAAPSIGPFNADKHNRILKCLLKVPQVFCVREELSKQYLKVIGISNNVHVTMDLAFLNTIDKGENEKKLFDYKELFEYLKKYPKTVGITITDFKWHVKLNKESDLKIIINESFLSFVRHLEVNGYGVLFIPQLFGNQNDCDFMGQFSSPNMFIMEDTMDTLFQQYIISRLFAVVGLRYHSNIFAAKMGTPFIAIMYEEKMRGFIEMSHLNDYSLLLNELSFENLVFKFSLLENNYDDLQKTLKEKLPFWTKEAKKTITLLDSIKY